MLVILVGVSVLSERRSVLAKRLKFVGGGFPNIFQFPELFVVLDARCADMALLMLSSPKNISIDYVVVESVRDVTTHVGLLI